MNNCIDCNKKLSRNTYIRCNSCARRGELNYNFKGIEKKCICIDCGNKISKTSYYYGDKRCKSCSCKGELNNFHGHEHNKNTRKKMSLSAGGTGIPYELEKYNLEKFNKKLKDQIRERDNYTCQKCGITIKKYLTCRGRNLDIHHIDYDKENCKENNLITLCQPCNAKANRNRDFWFEYFTYLMEKI
jgi:hypothetical protein